MATYIQGVTDSNLSPVLYKPDYTFLRYVLGKKDAQYRQGLSSVSSAYSNLKRDLTSPVNQETRAKFLQAAEPELLKLAGSDLSLQENVASANSIFDPLVTNQAFAFDAYHTSRNKSELQKMAQWRDSDDPEERKKFNQDLYDLVASDLDSLRNDTTGDPSKYKVRGYNAVAYRDAQDIVNKAVKDYGAEFSTDVVTGGTYISTMKDGAMHRQNYKEFADAVLKADQDYLKQNSLIATSQVNKILSYGKSNPLNAGKTDEQLIKEYAAQTFEKQRNTFKGRLNNEQEYLKTLLSGIQAEENINKGKPEYAPGTAAYNDLQQRKASALSLSKQIDQQTSKFNTEFGADNDIETSKQRYADMLSKDAVGYFANNKMQQDISQFANIKSSFGKLSIKKDDAYFAAGNLNLAQQKLIGDLANIMHDNATDDQKVAIQAALANYKMSSGTGALNLDNAVNTTGLATGLKGTTGADGKTKSSGIEYSGVSAVSMTKVQNFTRLADAISTNRNKALNALIGEGGGALSFLETAGIVDASTLGQLRTHFMQMSSAADNGSKYNATQQSKDALATLYRNLYPYAKEHKNEELLKDLRTNVGKDTSGVDFLTLIDKTLSKIPLKSDADIKTRQLWDNYKKSTEQSQYFSNLLNVSEKATVATLKDKQEFQDILKKGSDGKATGILRKEDIYNTLKKYTSGITEEEKQQIADAYVKGELDYTYQAPEDAYSATGTLNSYGKKERSTIEINGRTLTFTGVKLFPTESKDYAKKLKKFNESVVIPGLPAEFTSTSVTADSIFSVSGAVEEKIVNTLNSGATQISSNIQIYNSGDKTLEDVDPDEQVAIREAMRDPSNLVKNGTKVLTNSLGTTVVEVTLRNPTKSDKDASGIFGKAYRFPINNLQGATPEVFNIFNSVNEEYEYNKIKKDVKVADLNTAFESAGVKAQIQPRYIGSDVADVILSYKNIDPTTGQPTGDWITQRIEYNNKNVSIQELRQRVNNEFIYPKAKAYVSSQPKTQSVVGGGTVTSSVDAEFAALTTKYK